MAFQKFKLNHAPFNVNWTLLEFGLLQNQLWHSVHRWPASVLTREFVVLQICRSRFDFDVGLSVDVETVEPVDAREREVPLVQITPPPSTSSLHQSLNWGSCFENALFA